MPVAVKPFKVGNVEVGGGDLFLIACPCLVESEAHALKMAHAIQSITERLRIPYIFKSSYDKPIALRSTRIAGSESKERGGFADAEEADEFIRQERDSWGL